MSSMPIQILSYVKLEGMHTANYTLSLVFNLCNLVAACNHVFFKVAKVLSALKIEQLRASISDGKTFFECEVGLHFRPTIFSSSAKIFKTFAPENVCSGD